MLPSGPCRHRHRCMHMHTHMHVARGHLGKPELVRREENEKAQTKALHVVSVGGNEQDEVAPEQD